METIFNGSTKAKKIEFQMYRKSSFYSNNNYTEDWNNRKSYVLIKAVLKQQNKFTTNVQGQFETATSVTSGQATNILVSATAKQTNINNFHCHHTKTPSINNNIDEATPSPRSQFKVINVCNNFTAQKSISKLQINNSNDESSYVVNNFKNPVIKVRIESEPPSKYNINKENIKNRSQTYLNNTYNMKTQKHLVQQNTIDNYSYQFERKSKKVEFCKTEVHFTAESGRVNIVEIDGKPPPTKNFRRRRRHLQKNSPIYENTEQNSQLPAIEYPIGCTESNNNLTNVTNVTNETETDVLPTYQKNNNIDKDKDKDKYITHIDLTTPTSESPQPQIIDDEHKDSSEKDNTPKSILKNKPLKPLKSYHLGENFEHVESLNNLTVNTTNNVPHELNNQLSIVKQNLIKLQNTITLQEQTPYMKMTTNDIHSKRALLKPFKSPEAVKLIRNTNRDIQQRTSALIVNSSNNCKSNVGETKTTVQKIVPNVTNKRLLTNDEKNLLNGRKNREDSTNSKLIAKSSIDRFRIDRLRKKNDTDLTNNKKNTLQSPIIAPRTYTVINKIQLPPTTFQTLKSTSLVMNIIKNNLNMQDFPKKSQHFHSILNNNNNNNEKLLVSNQLEALKKLYENADEFSDDGEKTNDTFLSNNKKINDEINLLEKDEKCSELSGSWKKVRKIQPTAPKRKSGTYTKQRGGYSVNNVKDLSRKPVETPIRKQNENSRLYIKQK